MVVLSYMSFSGINRLNEISAWVNHTHIVKLRLQEVYSDLSDADSELNKFLLTKDSTYLIEMLRSENRTKSSLGELKELTDDNALQNARIGSLDSLVNVRFALMQLGLRQNREAYEDVAARINSVNTVTDDLINRIQDYESDLLISREVMEAEYKSWTPMVIFTIEIAIIGFLFLAYSHVAAELSLKAKLQTELERQMNFIRAILDNTVDAIIVFDKDLNILTANNAAISMFRIPESAIGKSLFREFPQSRGSISHKSILRALTGERVHVPNLKSQVVDRVYESFFTPLYNGKEVHAAMAIHHDITDLVRASEELEKRNDELNISNQQLEQFAYIASHDLQEPLRKIQTFSNLATKHLSSQEKVITYLTKIDNSAARMSKLVRDILNYSRLSSATSEREPVDLNEILDQVIQDFELIIDEKNARVQRSKLPVVNASRQQMLQLFGNLMSNSLKFTETSPEITIQSRDEGSFHVILFTDNGIGFDQKFEAQVFEVFKRLHGISAYSGTGIGLSICKRIVENHNGIINVQSTPGVGTTFIIHLPMIPEKNGTSRSIIGAGEKTAAGT